jgi:2,3-bisphosphoglycerate-independent phosphoglycerate mutase
MNQVEQGPTLLVILDGFGHREDPNDNAIAAANTPTWDRLWRTAPTTLISGSGQDVGLPEGQMGNSEVGHMSLGSGRVVYQSISKIDNAIIDGSFHKNPAYCQGIESAVSQGKAVHIMGLLSSGGVHSHERHIFEMLHLAAAKGATEIYLHGFLDGRDTPPRSALSTLRAAEEVFEQLGVGRVATITGRYWSMDRDQRWDRLEKSYRLLCVGDAEHSAASAEAGLEAAYDRGETDEFVAPTSIGAPAVIADGDVVIFMNFRADRARQLTEALTQKNFSGFSRPSPPAINLICTTEYSSQFSCPVAFPPDVVKDSFGEVLADQGLSQLRIAETEKYAHVTFFFSGGREALFAGEKRILVPSPDVATYDLQPEMSAAAVTDEIVRAIENRSFDCIIVNFANGDMVGHTGVFDAAVAAVEALDTCLNKIEAAVLAAQGQALITADHGNCEQMRDYESGQNHTQHTTEYVPLVYLGKHRGALRQKGGTLADVAPTLLTMMGIEQPSAMTGTSLIVSDA